MRIGDAAVHKSSLFCRHFDKAYGNKGIDSKVMLQCPGK
jgi:hypothetical protein